MGTSVLVVDDDPAVLSGLRRALTLEGYEVLVADSGESALAVAARQLPHLAVLDVMLPGLDGLGVCERLRSVSGIPILMLSARDSVADRVAGLNKGADDYLIKPFSLDELLARMRALLRRVQGETAATLSYADLVLDCQTREVLRAGRPLRLTPREHELLEFFLRHPRQVLSRDQLCLQVWGAAFEGESNFIDVAVKELRQKLEAEGGSRLIQTVRGYGYALREE